MIRRRDYPVEETLPNINLDVNKMRRNKKSFTARACRAAFIRGLKAGQRKRKKRGGWR